MGVRRMVVWSEYPAESRFPDLLYKRLNIVTEELDKNKQIILIIIGAEKEINR